jgi:hypothetical protein
MLFSIGAKVDTRFSFKKTIVFWAKPQVDAASQGGGGPCGHPHWAAESPGRPRVTRACVSVRWFVLKPPVFCCAAIAAPHRVN